MIGVVDEVVFDCTDPEALASFWSGILGGVPTGRDAAWWYILPPGFSQIAFQKVPEAKSVKNRVHLDVRVDDLGPAIQAAERLGARRTGGIHSDSTDEISFWVSAWLGWSWPVRSLRPAPTT